MRLVVLAPLALAACTAAPQSQSRPDVAWERDLGKSLALSSDGRELWRFQFDPVRPHAFFHPLALPVTPALTVDQPKDHPWHHGLWFSWKFIDGVNYWENAKDSDRPAGQTRFQPPLIDARPDGAATIRMHVDYAPGDGAPVLTEERTIAVGPPAADGSYTIDWTGRFVAHAERVVLDRTPLPGEPGGQVFGGYAGLSLRLANFEDRVVTTPDGPATFNADDRLRTRAPGLDYGGVIDGAPFGIAVLAHPDNVNSPSPWYAIRSPQMTFFTPAVLCYGPLELRDGARMTLRYRIFVHAGRWDAARLAEAAERFARTTSSDEEHR